jgi:hypothetical protein
VISNTLQFHCRICSYCHLLSDITKLGRSREAASCTHTEDFPNILGKLQVHHCVHKSLPIFSILTYIDPVHITPSIIILSTHIRLGLSIRLFSSDISSNILHANSCYMPCTHPTWLHLVYSIFSHFSPLNSGQFHNVMPWTIRHLLSAVSYLSKYYNLITILYIRRYTRCGKLTSFFLNWTAIWKKEASLPKKNMDVTMWQQCNFDSRIFGFCKINYSNIVLNFVKLSF